MRGQVLLRKDSTTLMKIYTVNFSPSLPERGLWPFTRVTVHWGKGNNHTFQRLPDTASELTLIPEDPKHHCCPPVRVDTYGGQVIGGILAQAHLTVGPLAL